jgi:phospholipase C
MDVDGYAVISDQPVACQLTLHPAHSFDRLHISGWYVREETSGRWLTESATGELGFWGWEGACYFHVGQEASVDPKSNKVIRQAAWPPGDWGTRKIDLYPKGGRAGDILCEHVVLGSGGTRRIRHVKDAPPDAKAGRSLMWGPTKDKDKRWTNNSRKIEHIFVLMLENRSFDHMFGALGLHGPDAVTGKSRPADAKRGAPGRAKEKFDVHLKGKRKDPNHEFPEVLKQLCGKDAPLYDPNKYYPPNSKNSYPPINNSGFADNYATVAGEAEKNDVMQSYERDQIPALATLAANYAVCDRWFSSMPGATTPNRFFVAAATSGGLDHTADATEAFQWGQENLDPGFNVGVKVLSFFALYAMILSILGIRATEDTGFKFKNGTIFDNLKRPNWRIYVDMSRREDLKRVSDNPLYQAVWKFTQWYDNLNRKPFGPIRFSSQEEIFPIDPKVRNGSIMLTGVSGEDLKDYQEFEKHLNARRPDAGKPDAGKPEYTAAYTFIEPDYGNCINTPTYDDGNSQHPIDDVRSGDRLIADVYNKIRKSPLWEKSMLIITWDEHGGFYDHVPPPEAIPPGDEPIYRAGNPSRFKFDRYGVRVPAVIVSPWIEKGVIDGRIYDHASIPKTVEDLRKLKPMTKRDAAANSLLPLLTLRHPRTDCPEKIEV